MEVGELALSAAFVIGLFGSLHCVGMCGGIVGLMSSALPANIRQKKSLFLAYLIAYNTGRILSYAVAGTAAGLIGAQALDIFAPERAHSVGRMISGAFIIVLGLYLAGWWHGLVKLEQQGQRFWKRIEPLSRRLLPIGSPTHALGLGAIWGWLPCGLVYSTLGWSLAAGGATQGASIMLAFGLGTVPMLLLIGTTTTWLVTAVKQPWIRRTAGTFLIVTGAMVFAAPTSLLQTHFGYG